LGGSGGRKGLELRDQDVELGEGRRCFGHLRAGRNTADATCFNSLALPLLP
jgi:hypothetical protein